MRVLAASVVVVCCCCALAGCGAKTPAQHAEEAVRALYAGRLDEREQERDALRRHGTARLQGYLTSLDQSCSEILNNDAPNHGLAGPALADFNRNCLDGRPLTCGGGTVVGAIDVGAVTSAGTTAIVHIGDRSAEVSLPLVGGRFVVDEVLCR